MNLISIFNQFPDQQSCIAHLEAFLKLFCYVVSLEQQMDHNNVYKGFAIAGQDLIIFGVDSIVSHGFGA